MFGAKRRNADGGPRTHVFAFDLERECELVDRYTGPQESELRQSRRRLVDEVAAYRLSGRLTPELLDACDVELALSKPDRSFGLRRLCELAADGHVQAKDRVRALVGHPKAEMRAAVIGGHAPLAFGHAELMDVARALLSDRSAKVRMRTAATAVFSNWFELAPAIHAAALAAEKERTARELFAAGYHLEKNKRTGHRNGYECDEESRAKDDAAMEAFLKAWRAAKDAGGSGSRRQAASGIPRNAAAGTPHSRTSRRI